MVELDGGKIVSGQFLLFVQKTVNIILRAPGWSLVYVDNTLRAHASKIMYGQLQVVNFEKVVGQLTSMRSWYEHEKRVNDTRTLLFIYDRFFSFSIGT